ncbi:hypothetical protein SDC9_82346 [bioreactor metagenome]|uniref:Uncharacterized protein n=1 Tax=bioreactor metagenome TaxID=1076179 RepID=A0A644ZAL4_9ZZZZ
MRNRPQRLARQQVHRHQAADGHPLRIDRNCAHGDHGHREEREQHMRGLARIFHIAVLAEALQQPAVVARLPGRLDSIVIPQHLERGAGIADFGRAPVELASVLHFLDATAAHLVGPPPRQHRHDDHGHKDHRQHGPGNDADNDQRDQRHRQIQHARGQTARHAGAHRAHVTKQLQPLAGRAPLQRQQRMAQHAVHQRLGYATVDGGAGLSQRTGAHAAQPQLQRQKAQHAGHHGRQRGRATARNHAVVDLQQKDGGQQAQQADGQRQPCRLVQVMRRPGKGTADGRAKGVVSAALLAPVLRNGTQSTKNQILNHGKPFTNARNGSVGIAMSRHIRTWQSNRSPNSTPHHY